MSPVANSIRCRIAGSEAFSCSWSQALSWENGDVISSKIMIAHKLLFAGADHAANEFPFSSSVQRSGQLYKTEVAQK